jgi:OmpA-OmpF porin, OOP family
LNKPVFYIILGFVFSSFAQENLIYNGDFEEYDTCPTSISTPGDYQIEHCLGWYSPTYATSDYFNACANWPASVPVNITGNRTPFSGSAYCGVYIENCTYPSCPGWFVEYLQSKLKKPLEANKKYEFSCYIALSSIYYQYSFSEFGAHFTSAKLSSNNFKPFEIQPVLKNKIGKTLSDTINWFEFKSDFTAKGGEEYITLGFYIDTLNIDTLITDPFFDPLNFGSYYYIDKVSLNEKIDSDIYPNIFTPNIDGKNEEWRPFNEFKNIIIINRWGNPIKEINYPEGWDGKDKYNNNCSEGVYYYKVHNINDEIKTGFIQLIR